MRSTSTVLFGSLLACSLVAVIAPSGALARTPAPAAKAAKGEPEILTRFEAAVPKLGLWPEQKPRIQKLIAEVRASLKKVEAAGGTPEQKQVRLQAIHAKAQDGLNHVLTVAQAEKLKKLMSAAPKQKK
ncbi:MAG: hypothetical protein ACO1SX_12370 [Actinomycetota bacterium]